MLVSVVGGGIGGCAGAVALLRQGIDIRLFEQAQALTEVGPGVAVPGRRATCGPPRGPPLKQLTIWPRL